MDKRKARLDSWRKQRGQGMRTWLMAIMMGVLGWLPAAAQDLSALARLDAAASSLVDQGETLSITLRLSQPVPWRVRLADNPRRLIMDFREVDWSGIAAMPRSSTRIADLRAGSFRPGWSRLVMELNAPLAVLSAEMATAEGATVSLASWPHHSQGFRPAGGPAGTCGMGAA